MASYGGPQPKALSPGRRILPLRFAANGRGPRFLFASGAHHTVDVVGATTTLLTRINNNGHVAGVFMDALGEAHGLTGR
jgi:hypothetical protein